MERHEKCKEMECFRLFLNKRSSILLGMIVFFSILSTDIATLSSKAQNENPYIMSTNEWGVEAGDVLSYKIQLSLDNRDLIHESGYRSPLIIISRVENLPQGPEYVNSEADISSNLEIFIIEYQLGNSRFSPELFAERFPRVHNFSLAQDLLMVVPINVLDYYTSIFRSGWTDKTEDSGITQIVRIDYSGSYFRVTEESSYPEFKIFTSSTIEISRSKGIAEEIIIIQRTPFNEEEAVYFGINPGIHTIEEHIDFFKIEKLGYQHMGTPGFIFLIGAASLSIYVLLHKQKRFSKTVKE